MSSVLVANVRSAGLLALLHSTSTQLPNVEQDTDEDKFVSELLFLSLISHRIV